MGRVKKNRGRRDDQQPDSMHWTPIRHACGCVVEQGWDGTSPPPVFIQWCMEMIDVPCVWHGAETGLVPPPDGVTAKLNMPTGGAFYARQVPAGSTQEALGRELTRQTQELRSQMREDGPSGILMTIPAKYQRITRAKGRDPVQTWVDARLTDIFLNLGRIVLTDEMIDALPEP